MKTFVIVFYILSGQLDGSWRRVEFPYESFSSLELCRAMIGNAHPPQLRATVITCEEKK